MASLPKDIIVDILIQLPIKSLVRFKFVCKLWRSLISYPGFVTLHMNKEERQRFLLVGSVKTIHSIDYEYSCVSNNASIEAMQVDLPIPMRSQYFRIVGCCDGLLCLVINGKNVVLWNPSTGEFRELPCPGPYSGVLSVLFSVMYEFGYDSSIDDYKVIRYLGDEMKILSLKTNTWRSIQNLDYDVYSAQSTGYDAYSTQIGELLNGAIHWNACYYIDSRHENKIVGLDLVEEKLFEVPQPDHNNITTGRRQLSVLGGCLCLARIAIGEYLINEIWLMQEYGVGDSWTKLISNFCYGPIQFLVPQCIMNNGEILLWREDRKLFIYNLDEKTFKDLEIYDGPLSWWNSWNYKESLVSPKESLFSPNEGNVIEY